jgi:hypothetical protein
LSASIPIEKELLYASAAIAAFAAVRLVYLGLAKLQPALFLFLLLNATGSFVLIFPSPKSPAYFYTYVIYEAVAWCVNVAAVRELFALILDDYPGIRTAGRWMMYAAVTIATFAFLIVTVFFWDGGAQGRGGIFYVLSADRYIRSSLAIVIVILLLFLSRYPLHLHRNKYVSSYFCGAIFLMESTANLLDTLSPKLFSHSVDTAQLSVTCLLFLGWGLSLRREVYVLPEPKIRIPEEDDLLFELESMNRTLAGVGRR